MSGGLLKTLAWRRTGLLCGNFFRKVAILPRGQLSAKTPFVVGVHQLCFD
jgi:hypothetical protein